MTTFDNRDKAFENKYAHDEEMNFKITARRNKLLGLWVAEKLCLSEEDAKKYAIEVVESDFQQPGDEDVVDKVLKDLRKNGIRLTERDIRVELERFAGVAREQIAGKKE